MRNKYIAPILIVALCFAALSFAMLGRHAQASMDAPPPSMSPLDAARLHAAVAELNAANQKIEAIKASVAPLEKQATDILGAYKINAADFGKTVTVDFDTGAITRAAKPPEPSKPQVAAAPKAVQK